MATREQGEAPVRLVRGTGAEPAADLSVAVLVERARAGKADAARLLFERHQQALTRLAVRMAFHPHEVEDLVQETMLQAFESLHRLSEPAAFPGWIRSILVRTALRWLRRHQRRARWGLAAARTSLEVEIRADAPPHVCAELREIYASLDTLDPEVRTALLLWRVEGLKHTEIAELMGMSVPTIKRRLNLAKAHIERFRDPPGGPRHG